LMGDQKEHVIIGRVRSLGSRTPPEARITLVIDDKPIATQSVDLSDRPEAVVTFRTRFAKRDSHRAALTVDDEYFTPDNTFFFTVNVQRPLAVLAVAPGASAGEHADASRWFESAVGSGGGSRFHLDVIQPAEFTGDGLQQYDVIVLLDVGELAPSRVADIDAFLKRGGGLLMAPGNRVTAQSFNRQWQGLTPAGLDRKHVADEGEFLTIAELNRRHPILKQMGLNETGDFGAVRFQGHWRTQPAEDSDVILRFDNGAAALLEKKVGRGRVLLFTVSLDTGWSNLPRQGWYVPLVHETLGYLASREPVKASYTVGEPVRLHLPAGNAVRVTGPTGQETILTSAIEDAVYFRAADRPGFYSVGGLQAGELLAVNAAPAESDLVLVAPDQMRSEQVHATRPNPGAPRTPAASIAARADDTQQLWWWILLAVMALGLGETLLANRTYR
jgi:hypothetical protein